jgi:hypothetical protein
MNRTIKRNRISWADYDATVAEPEDNKWQQKIKTLLYTTQCVRFIGHKNRISSPDTVVFFEIFSYNKCRQNEKTTSEEVVLKHTCAAGRTGDFEESLFELVA